MNKRERNRVIDIVAELNGFSGKVNDLAEELRTLADAEQEKFDNLTESLQQNENGQRIENAARSLDELATSASDAGTALEDLSFDEE
jgi:hypothetical protein